MAFSATVRGNLYLGGAGGLKVTYGDWTGASGDAAGTLSVSGGYPLMAIFQKFDAIDKTYQIVPRVEVSVSGSVATITIENQDDVTTGRFLVVHAGS